MLPDYFEMRESSCESWYYENVKNGIATCGCGKEYKFEEGEATSADPYAIPVCPACFNEWFEEREMEHIRKQLEDGKTAQFRPKGNSMQPKIESGQLVTISPDKSDIKKHDIVFCRVKGNYYVHLVQTVTKKLGGERYQIGNNKNHTNGTIGIDNIFGKVVKVES